MMDTLYLCENQILHSKKSLKERRELWNVFLKDPEVADLLKRKGTLAYKHPILWRINDVKTKLGIQTRSSK